MDTVKPKTIRTGLQNSALHVDCQIIADKLNDAGKDMREVIKQEIEIPWTMLSVKEYIFKPIMKAMYQIDSTTELTKNEQQIDKIHQVIMRELGQKHGIEYHEFPHIEKKEVSAIQDMHKRVEYPERVGEDKF